MKEKVEKDDFDEIPENSNLPPVSETKANNAGD